MSLTINVTTPEGLVLAADSRQSYRNKKGQARVGSDSAIKVIQLGNRVGVTLAGPAFLPENGTPKNVSKFVEDFKRENNIDSLAVEEITKRLKTFFEEKYNYKEQLKKLPENIKNDLKAKGLELLEMKELDDHVEFTFRDKQGKTGKGAGGVDVLSLMVAGYDLDGSHHVRIAYVPGDIQEKRNSKIKGKEYGASWTGQIDVVARIVLGRDPRTMNLLIQKGFTKEGVTEERLLKEFFGGLEYAISWGTMTLQDAIDFCRLMIETTSAIQKFSDGIAMDPGDIPGVGGPIDIAVITPDKGFVWVNKKKLAVGDLEVDLDKVPDLQPSAPEPKKPSKKRKSE